MYSEIDDLIGESPKKAPRSTRIEPRRPHIGRKRNPRFVDRDEDQDTSEDLNVIKRGVSTNWLANLYDISRKTVSDKLVGCPIVGTTRNKGPLYDLTVAAGYLSARKRDIASIIKSLKEEELPLPMQRKFWQTAALRTKWETEAGDLWRTDDVLSVFSETFKTLKNSLTLWVDNVDAESPLSDRQRAFLVEAIDALAEELHEQMVDLPRRRRTVNLKEAMAPSIEKMMDGLDDEE